MSLTLTLIHPVESGTRDRFVIARKLCGEFKYPPSGVRINSRSASGSTHPSPYPIDQTHMSTSPRVPIVEYVSDTNSPGLFHFASTAANAALCVAFSSMRQSAPLRHHLIEAEANNLPLYRWLRRIMRCNPIATRRPAPALAAAAVVAAAAAAAAVDVPSTAASGATKLFDMALLLTLPC